MNRYTSDDKICPHCGGNLSPHSTYGGAIIWCDICGSNSPEIPPNISINQST